MDKHDKLQEAIGTICDILTPQAKLEADNEGRKLLAVLSSMVRPLIGYHLDPQSQPKLKYAQDNRTRDWRVKIYFWNLDRGTEGAELIAENDEEIIRGLPAVGGAIREYAADIHGEVVADIPVFSELDMSRRMGGMHPAIVRGGGSAISRIRYEIDGAFFLCQVDISRA